MWGKRIFQAEDRTYTKALLREQAENIPGVESLV